MNESSLIVDSFSVDSIDINQSNNNVEDESIELLNNNKQMIEIINFINMNGETNVKLIRDKILKEYNIKLKKREVSRLIDIVNKFNETSEFISLD